MLAPIDHKCLIPAAETAPETINAPPRHFEYALPSPFTGAYLRANPTLHAKFHERYCPPYLLVTMIKRAR